MEAQKQQLISRLSRDRYFAHACLFPHRHPDETPQFHALIIDLWHSMMIKRGLLLAFREAGKSTIAEEAIVIQALLGSFRNAVLIGENEARAADRLNAIKYELMNNPAITDLFGDMVGDVWGYSKIILKNGVVIQALGRRQEVRGMKHLDTRPDLMFGDDLEGKEHVKDAVARHDTLQWLFAEVVPALDKNARIRIQATPLDREALPMVIKDMPGWTTLSFPIRYKDAETSSWRPTWPARYPLSWIEEKEKELYRLGLHHDFMREYMCEAEDPAKKTFTSSMFVTTPRTHVWQATFAMFDPARTTNPKSASTGWAVWSWINKRLIIWDGGGAVLKPDEIIDLIFKVNNQYRPVMLGVEKDGLEEFIMQPLRHEMVKRGVIVPIKPMSAPDNKGAFIEALQPLFVAGEVEFAKDLAELKAQFLSYPTGRIDGPNALAYAPILRPGLPIYDNFASYHVVERVLKWENAPLWLCLNATSAMTTGVLLQLCDGAIHVIADWVREGDPGANVKYIVDYARLEADRDIRLIAGSQHFASYDHVGLRGAVRSLPGDLIQGGDPLAGRAVIRDLLEKQLQQVPAIQVAHAAHWTLNGFNAGYAREIKPDGTVKESAREGIYRTLMEGIEAFAGLLKTGMLEEDRATNWAYTSTGKPYKTILPGRQGPADEKSNWIGVVNRSVRRR